MSAVSLAYASRFGSTARLAATMAEALGAAGAEVALLDVATGAAPDPQQPLVVLSAVIWDRPLPAMRQWLNAHQTVTAARTVAAGVVCGSAGVRPGGGMSYARRLVQRTGSSTATPFALSGTIPPRAELAGWEWWMLKAFAGVMRKPQLFAVQADEAGARTCAFELGPLLGLELR